jgi:hypothetical protein
MHIHSTKMCINKFLVDQFCNFCRDILTKKIDKLSCLGKFLLFDLFLPSCDSIAFLSLVQLLHSNNAYWQLYQCSREENLQSLYMVLLSWVDTCTLLYTVLHCATLCYTVLHCFFFHTFRATGVPDTINCRILIF